MVYKVLRIYHLQLKEGLWEVSVSHLHRMVIDQGHVAQGEITEWPMRKAIISYNGDRKGMVRKTGRTLAECGIIEGKGEKKAFPSSDQQYQMIKDVSWT